MPTFFSWIGWFSTDWPKPLSKMPAFFLLISSFDFQQDFITYAKRQRVHGKSGWSLKKKLKLFMDSVTMFSKGPLYWMVGMSLALVITGGFLSMTRASAGLLLGGAMLIAAGLTVLGAGFLIMKGRSTPNREPLFLFEKRSDRPKK